MVSQTARRNGMTVRSGSRRLFGCFGALICWVAIACSAPGAYAERVIIAYVSPSTSYLPLMVAHRKGFLEEENFQVDLVRTNTGIIIQVLMAGSVDYVTTSTADRK